MCIQLSCHPNADSDMKPGELLNWQEAIDLLVARIPQSLETARETFTSAPVLWVLLVPVMLFAWFRYGQPPTSDWLERERQRRRQEIEEHLGKVGTEGQLAAEYQAARAAVCS